MISSLLLAALIVGQGEAASVTVAHEPGLVAVTVEWVGERLPLAAQPPLVPGGAGSDGEWLALLGIDIDEPAGDRMLRLHLLYADGRESERPFELTVTARSYPETRLTVEDRYVALNPADQSRATAEAQEIARIYATVTADQQWRAPFGVPIDSATGGRNFGHRRFFNGEPRAPHSGADLRAAEGTPVHAANRGTVVLAKPLFFSGNAVFLDHGMGVYSVYLHLSEFRVAVGDTVERGGLLGLAGSTGRVTGPHLHWGVRIHGARVDPFSLVEAIRR